MAHPAVPAATPAGPAQAGSVQAGVLDGARASARAGIPVEALAELGLTEELVIGEAVVLDLRPASFATRSLALALDLMLQFVAMMAALMLLGLTVDALDPAAGTALTLVIVVSVLVGMPVTIETLSRGRSVGKLATGLRVVREDGGPIRFRQALVRGLLAVFEIYLTTGTVALIVSLANERGRRLGDLLAGSYVIRERAGTEFALPLVMPPELAGWARAADIGRIPDPLALASRQFLRRAERLHPAHRQRLGLELAGRVAEHVAPATPAGVHPERFLAAVLTERRDRDLARLRAEQDARHARELRRANAGVLASGSTALLGTAGWPGTSPGWASTPPVSSPPNGRP